MLLYSVNSLRMRVLWAFGIFVLGLLLEGLSLGLSALALFLSPDLREIAFRWADQNTIGLLVRAILLGRQVPLMLGLYLLGWLLVWLGLTVRFPRRRVLTFFLATPALLFGPPLLASTLPWGLALWIAGIPLLLVLLEERQRGTRFLELLFPWLALAALAHLLQSAHARMRVWMFEGAGEVLLAHMIFLLFPLFGGLYLWILRRRWSAEPSLAAPVIALVLIPVFANILAAAVPTIRVLDGELVRTLSPEEPDYGRYYWVGEVAGFPQYRFAGSILVQPPRRFQELIEVGAFRGSLMFSEDIQRQMRALLDFPLLAGFLRVQLLRWIRRTHRAPCEPFFTFVERTLVHYPNPRPTEMANYRMIALPCEGSNPMRVLRMAMIFYSHGFPVEGDEILAFLEERLQQANRLLPRAERFSVEQWKRFAAQQKAIYARTERKTGLVEGKVLVEDGVLREGEGIRQAVRVGLVLLQPPGGVLPRASPLGAYVQPDWDGSFRLEELPVGEYAVAVALRKEAFAEDPLVLISHPRVRLTEDAFYLRGLRIELRRGGAFFAGAEALSTLPRLPEEKTPPSPAAAEGAQ